MLENPPDEIESAVSGKFTVDPTEVTNGQPDGNVGTKSEQLGFSP